MPKRYQKLLAMLLIGLLGLSPLLVSATAYLASQDAMHCKTHKAGHCPHHEQGHKQGQCDNNGSCTMDHCHTQSMTTVHSLIHAVIMLAGIDLPFADQVPTSTDPVSLYRPPQA